MMKCLKVEDALSYLDQVKARFSGQGAIYMDFLDVMRDFKAQTVRELFEGHPDLITGFNTFIPQGYRMDAAVSTVSQPFNIRPVCTTIARTTLSVSITDNISPLKSVCTSIKSSEINNDWPMGCIPVPVVSHYENSMRPVYTPMISNNISNICALPQPIRAPTPLSHTDSPLYNANQQFISQDYQENYPNVPVRNSHSASNSLNNQFHNPPHVHQQQQQIQSFHHALHYVNKIKNRFQGIPDVYKRFLDILQWYQKEQRHSDPLRRKQAELQVYQDVAKLFDGQEDLLQEFSQFLPESFGVTNAVTESIGGRKSNHFGQFGGSDSLDVSSSVSQLINRVSEGIISAPLNKSKQNTDTNLSNETLHSSLSDAKKLKRLAPNSNTLSALVTIGSKKARSSIRDIRDCLDADNSSESRSYQTFLQNVRLFHRCIISAEELLEATYPLFARHVEVWKCFSDLIMSTSRHSHNEDFNQFQSNQTILHNYERDFKGRENRSYVTSPSSSNLFMNSGSSTTDQAPVSFNSLVTEVPPKRLDLDFTKLRICGVSYRALPSNFPQSKCSGRQKCSIAKEVLNDSYISFSSLTSEDSQFVSSKKNQYEENMYRVEDERYEVDMVTELNRAAMQNLVVIKRQMDRMNRDELAQFHLDDKLGGTSAILMRKAVHRVYGDKAGDVIYGLKNCPNTVIPLVIQRMRQKDTEWHETIRNYQRTWADQDARNYLRSLDHQGATFKQRDAPFIRSKTMVSQIDTIARNEKHYFHYQNSDLVGKMISASLTRHNIIPRDLNYPGSIGSALANVLEGNDENEGPHLTLLYPPPEVRLSLMEDAASLIIHHVKRQSNASKDDKRAMKCLIRNTLQDIFMANRFSMSDDEDDDEEDDETINKADDEEMPDENNCDVGNNSRGRLGFRHFKNKRGCEMRRTNQLDDMSTSEQKDKMDTDFDRSTVENHIFDANCERLFNHSNTNTLSNENPPMENAYVTNLPRQESYSVLYGNNHWYAFIRLHHLLLCRLYQLRSWSTKAAAKINLENNDSHVQASEVLRLRRFAGIEPSQYYSRALNLVKDLLDGGEDITTYEDRLRDMFGIYAYPWFTMDRLIINIVRQLQALSSGDELSRRLTTLYRSWIDGSNLAERVSSNRSQTVIGSNHFDICGPLYTRFCRLGSENTYYSQAMAICSSFNNGSNPASTNANVNCSSGVSNVAGQNNSTNLGNGNCYMMVMLSEASSMLIRLMRPACVSNCEKGKNYGMCHPYSSHLLSCNSHLPMINDTNIDVNNVTCMDRKLTIHRQNFKLDVPIRHWYDYLSTHLSWTIGCVPQNICSRIRPVFLYRTVRRCINSLTREAMCRRQQDLTETGDTQPEEIMANSFNLIGNAELERNKVYSAINDDSIIDTKSNASMSSEHDIWEFMCRVFKNSLTKKELFRDTFSSDCMQSIQRLDARSTPRNHKINWSVGSYGIFFRCRKRPSNSNTYCSDKWHRFHSTWLSKQRLNDSLLDLTNKQPINTEKELSPIPCNDATSVVDDNLSILPDTELKDNDCQIVDTNSEGDGIADTSLDLDNEDDNPSPLINTCTNTTENNSIMLP